MKVSKSYKNNKDIVFLAITDEGKETKDKTLKWLERNGVPFLVGLGSPSFTPYKVEAYPTTMVIGADGKILWHDEMEGSLEKAIKRALAKKKK